jgi:hypothetical protein
MIKKIISFFASKKKSFPSNFHFFTTASIYIFLFLIMYYYIRNENIFFFIVVAFSTGILYYYLSDLIKYSDNKYISFLQDFVLNIFIIFIVTFVYILFISIYYLNLVDRMLNDGIEELSKEVSNRISSNKMNVELTKNANNEEVYNISIDKAILEKIGKLGEGIITQFMGGIINQIGPAAAGGTIGAKALKITSLANMP